MSTLSSIGTAALERTRTVLASCGVQIFLVIVLVSAASGVAAAQAAPAPLAPADGAGVTVPFTISWSAVLPPSQVNGGYNWQVSPSSSFSTLVLMDATNPAATQDTVSGLTVGTYFWRVNAVNSALQTSAWSTVRSFTVTGANAGSPGTPVLAPTRGYSTFHPWESIHFDWSVVPDAMTYRLEVSNDSSFPLGTVPPGTQTFWNDNIPTNQDGYVHTMEGNWFARVFAVNADNPQTGVRGLPSNVIQFSCFFNNPIGPPPVLLSPLGNPTLTLPVTISWAHVPNPQSSGYILEIATNSGFTNIEWFYNQYTEPTQVMLSLTSGPKFWRVRSQHGMSSPTTVAVTAPSTTGTFTISSAPPTPVSIMPMGNEALVVYSGANGFQYALQLTAGVPAGGATIPLTSSHPSAIPLPASVSMPGTHAWTSFPVNVGHVTTPTVVTLIATLNGVTASNQVTVRPPTLNDDPLQSVVRATGGTTMNGWVNLEGSGTAGPGGIVVNLSDDSPSATVPATVTIAAGFNGGGFSIPTSSVTTTTPVTITATAGGVTTQWLIWLEPSSVPNTFFVQPMSTTNGSQGTVIAQPGGFDQLLPVTSSNPALASVPSTVTVSAGSGIGFFPITTAPVTSPTTVTISVTGGGVTLSWPLTLYPSLPLLSSLTVSPTSVVGGNPATGTVTLGGPAPAVGVAINLSSGLPNTASVPDSVTVTGGATSATFPITTFPSSLTTVSFSAAMDNVFQNASLNVGPPAPPPTPGTPSLLSPANQATVAQPITFDWSDASNAVSYFIQIDNSSSFTTPLTFTQTVSASTTTVTGLPAQQLWWRVRGINSAGVNGSFSSSRRFTAQGAPPAASLSAVSVNPTSVVGGNGSTGTVTLTSAAPSGGLVVNLSDNSTAATVPASVTVASGATTATFAVTTTSVATSTAVTLTATQGANTRTTTLTVTPVPPPASLSAVSVNPTSVTGGNGSTGTVTLTSAAPTGGLLVSLSSSNATVASVPASVTVASGATSASFTVTTTTVASSTSVTITGTQGANTRTATLTVNPVPTGPLPAPSLVAPANDARFSPGQNITFDWSDVTGAATYTIQIDTSQSFTTPLTLQQTVTPSQFSTSTLPTQTMWWRVRANDSAGNPGNWSSSRRVEVKD